MTYSAPLRDMRFVYFELFDDADLRDLPGYDEASPDLVDAVLAEAGKIAADLIHPLNRTGDEEGCTFENGVVRTPAGFKDAYETYTRAGWTGLTADPEYGGQGMPHALGILIDEMINSANLSFAMYAGLSHGAYEAINHWGSADLKHLYLPKFTSGAWSGAMCLTEPQCGTDLGLLRTKALPRDDGRYEITGTKIFISAGDHDLTDNIVHLVLARLPDAPPGIKGISLFVVPKFAVKADGSLGSLNGVSTGAIEHKMGIKASSTCVINFDNATGDLIGAPHQGMRAMFTFMNAARLAVGMQGMSLGETAYQGAVAYARDRRQGRALGGDRDPDQAADSILVHPDVRRMLLTMRAYTEGSRMLTGWVARELDFHLKSPDPERRARADDLAGLLTPIVKALQTDLGFTTTNLGLQVFGGHGYIREHGIEQLVRDARITQIYEGTNGIQALDLVGRKMPRNMGRALRYFFHPVDQFIASHKGDAAMAPFIKPLAKVFGRLQRTTAHVALEGLRDPNEAGAAASEYLRLFGLTALAYLWAQAAKIALEKRADDPTWFYRAKLNTARFYMARLLPESGALMASILAGAETIMAFADEDF